MDAKQYREICEKLDLFFKEALDEAIHNQHVRLSPEAAFYLLRIITYGFSNGPNADPKSLGQRYLEAFSREDAQPFKAVGDTSLLIAGIWWQHLLRMSVDVDYYLELGSRSYQKASETSSKNLSELFEELSRKFSAMADVLTETTQCISDAKMTDKDILRMYEVWLRTHNIFLERKLRSLGINPVPGKTTRQ